MRTGHNCLGDVSRKADAAVGDQGNIGTFKRRRDIGNGRDLRDTCAGDDTSGANRTWAYPHLDSVHPGLRQGNSGVAGGDIAAYNLHGRVGRLDHLHPLYHVAGVTMGSVDHQNVDTSTHQGFNPVICVGAGAHRGANPQLAMGVLAGQREAFSLVEVLDRNHPAQIKGIVYHQDFLYAVLV